jgi:ATP adenylyltransferase
MDYIWSPWRYKYIAQSGKESGCIFCNVIASDDDQKNYVIHRAKSNFVILNLFPYTSGHAMVVPFQHQATLADLDETTTTEMMELAKKFQRALEAEYHPDGINIGINLGQAAGAGVAQHMHLHIVPRWFADANFMTITSETRVLPEDLATTYERLRKYF